MNEENKNSINYIFYLQTKADLDHNYYLLAEIFSKVNINLVPIEALDLKNMERSKKQHLIVVRNDLSSAFAFKENRKLFLDSAMASDKILVYDVSSFSEIENAAKFENKNVYRFFQLPLNIKQLAMTIAVDFFREKNKTPAEWPGGRRAKLPSMINSN